MKQEMAYPPGMELHGAGWRVTKRVPQDLLPYYAPKKHLRFQTGEPDKRAASVAAWRWRGEMEVEFQRIRETGSRYKGAISSEETSHLVRLMIRSTLEADEEMRDAGDYADDEGFAAALARLDSTDEETRNALSRRIYGGDLPLIVEDWLLGHGYEIPRDSAVFGNLCLEFAKGRSEAVKAKNSRNAGDWVETPPVPVLAPSTSPDCAPLLSEVNRSRGKGGMQP